MMTGDYVQPLSTSAALVAMNAYGREHVRATMLLNQASQNYASARCLLLNGLLGGLVFGAQAIEKFLKAYILFNDPNRDVKKFLHSLVKLAQEVASLYPQIDFSKYAPLAQKFASHYATRYPGDPAASTSMTTADLSELDECVIFLNENLPCPRNVKYRTGLYVLVTFSLSPPRTVTPWERWIKANNQSLAPLIPRINADHFIVLTDLYPDRQW
jgi:HEPN domain-containing protein